MKNMKKSINLEDVDDVAGEIFHCDTLSTESPSNSITSISPVNGDEKDNNRWIKDQPTQNEVRKIDRKTHKKRLNKQSLNDGVILSHLQIGEIISLKDDDKSDDVLIAPSTIEERQNEKYARKVGIHFSLDKGDYLTLAYGSYDDELSASVESDLSASPRYGKKDEERTLRRLFGSVAQILDQYSHQENVQFEEVQTSSPTAQLPHQELITPRTRTAMIDHEQIVETLRPIAATLSVDWGSKNNMAPGLARRLRDFEFAQKKRRRAIGISRKWGLLSLYDFLAAVREDVDWADDAAWRRANCLPYVRWIDFIQSKRLGSTGSSKPIFVYSILFACTIALITSIGINDWTFESLKQNPSFGPSAETLIIMGAKHSDLIVNDLQIWRLFTPMFLHGGIIHYVLNCFAMFYIGRAVEQSHGTLSTAILFIIPAVGSVLLSAIFLPQYISVGSSGGIFGLIGACVTDVMRNRKLLFSDFVNKGLSKRHHFFVIVILVLDIILNLLTGLTPFTDNFMHLGGFVLGVLCASTMLNVINLFGLSIYHDHNQPASLRNTFSSRYFGLIISIICMIVASIFLFKGDGTTSPCESCGILSCVSFPPWNNYDNRWWYCDDCGEVRGLGKIDDKTGEYYAIELLCPDGNSITFSLGEDVDKSHESLEAQLPMFCRKMCMN